MGSDGTMASTFVPQIKAKIACAARTLAIVHIPIISTISSDTASVSINALVFGAAISKGVSATDQLHMQNPVNFSTRLSEILAGLPRPSIRSLFEGLSESTTSARGKTAPSLLTASSGFSLMKPITAKDDDELVTTLPDTSARGTLIAWPLYSNYRKPGPLRGTKVVE